MQRTVLQRIHRLARRAMPSRAPGRTLTAGRLQIVDARGDPRIVLEVVEGVALVRVLAGDTDVAIHAVGPIDDDPAMAGISLRSGRSDVDTWEIRGTPR